MKKTVIILVVALVVLVVAALAFRSFKSGNGAEVETEVPAMRIVAETVAASGKIQPELEVKITTEVSGQIIELPVKEGDEVKKGDLLVKINPDIYEAAVTRATAALNQSRSNLASAKSRKAQADAQLIQSTRAYERSKELVEQGAISQADYDQSLSGYEVATAEVLAATEAIKSAEFQILSALRRL
ncbi:MAG: biotin/lipoyl-binding protein [Flavobacteriales bacterium]|nr:biotin/lipoyl-binding protein [Flavobacteriales bacterium]